MPKGILEFNLPEEENEFRIASEAPRLISLIWEIQQHLRLRLKYDDLDENTTEEIKKIQQIIFDANLEDFM